MADEMKKLKMQIEAYRNAVEFEPERHIYKKDGVILPSVSQVMQPLSHAVYGEIDPDVLKLAAAKGTEIHRCLEDYMKFGIVDYPKEYEGYIKAFEKWKSAHKVEMLATEYRVYHRVLNYAGTIDLLCMVDGVPTIIDYKTTVSINKILTGVQLEAYRKALDSFDMIFVQKIILHLKADGEFTLQVHPVPDTTNWSTFSALLEVKKHIDRYKIGG